MTDPKIHISRAIWDKDTHEVAYIDGLMFADIGTQRKLNAVDDMYEALETVCGACIYVKLAGKKCCKYCIVNDALRKARGETE